MYNNIGGKLKTLAVVGCVLGIITFFILGIIMGEESPLIAIIYVVIGSFCSWLGSLATYGLGECCEQLEYLRNETSSLRRAFSEYAHPEQKKVYNGSSAAPPPRAKVTHTTSAASWTCKKCGAHNNSSVQTCKDCGAYK